MPPALCSSRDTPVHRDRLSLSPNNTRATCGILWADPPIMSTSQLLQQLYPLDTSSQSFLRILFALIRKDEHEQYLASLEGAELRRLVDFLDVALCSIPPCDDVFRQSLRKLRHICGAHATLPSSHIINGDLTKTGIGPYAYGGFADVWKGEHDGKEVCIKMPRISLNDANDPRKSFFKEAVVWKRLRHPNIVSFLGVTTNPLQLVSEWMPNGTLTQYVEKNPGSNRISLLLDVAEGLHYLHASYTIHGDLKGPNILVNGAGHACLADFGLASIVHGNSSIVATEAHGYTARWTAPEILKGADKMTWEADVFSFGMVVIEAFTGKHPFCEWKHPAVMVKIIEGERPAYPQGTEALGFVAQIWDMAVDCWRHDSTQRPTMAAVVGFLRECYALCNEDPSLSTLSPWELSRNTGDASVYGPISPTLTDGNTSPNPSAGTSQNPNHSFLPSREHSGTQGPRFDGLFPSVPRRPPDSLDGSLSDDSPANLNPGRFYGVNDYREVGQSSTNPRPQNGGKGKPPRKTGGAMWKGIAAIIRFKVFARGAPKADHDGR